MSLLLRDEQVSSVASCDYRKPADVHAWLPSYERAPRPVAGSGPCRVYDVRGPEALAKRVYGMALMWAISSRRVDDLARPREVELRACAAFACAWRPHDHGPKHSAPATRGSGFELADWLVGRRRAQALAERESAALVIARLWRERQGRVSVVHLSWWDGARTRRWGKLEAHVVYLQRLFREASMRVPGSEVAVVGRAAFLDGRCIDAVAAEPWQAAMSLPRRRPEQKRCCFGMINMSPF